MQNHKPICRLSGEDLLTLTLSSDNINVLKRVIAFA